MPLDREQPKPGRPLAEETPASGHIHLRVTMERKNRYVSAARKRQSKLSEWMYAACDAAAGADNPNPNPNPETK